MRGFSILSYIIGLFCLGMGLYRFLVYENSELSFIEPKNAWVGGDAYNYIINGTHATSFFILFLTFIVIGLSMEFLIKKNEQIALLRTIAGTNETKVEQVVEEGKEDEAI